MALFFFVFCSSSFHSLSLAPIWFSSPIFSFRLFFFFSFVVSASKMAVVLPKNDLHVWKNMLTGRGERAQNSIGHSLFDDISFIIWILTTRRADETSAAPLSPIFTDSSNVKVFSRGRYKRRQSRIFQCPLALLTEIDVGCESFFGSKSNSVCPSVKGRKDEKTRPPIKERERERSNLLLFVYSIHIRSQTKSECKYAERCFLEFAFACSVSLSLPLSAALLLRYT